MNWGHFQMENPQLLLTKIVERERRLRELSENPKENARECNQIIECLLREYQSLIVEHTSVATTAAAKTGKDVVVQLWKTCWYRRIEDYRKSIKKHSHALETTRDNEELVLKLRAHLAQLNAKLAQLLSSAANFYQEMMLQLEKRAAMAAQSLQLAAAVGGRLLVEDLQVCRCHCFARHVHLKSPYFPPPPRPRSGPCRSASTAALST